MLIRVVLLVLLLLFRFYDLGVRPPHHDEAVNGWFVDGIFSRGYYQYDPSNYHGPLFFYFLAFFEWVFGRSIEALRLTPLLFGALVTGTPWLFRRWLGSFGTWTAMFFLAVSPAMVFYSRYAIHELMFAFFCILYFYFWAVLRTDGFKWQSVWGLGLSLGAMASLKENFIIFVVSLGIAEVMTRVADQSFRPRPAFQELAAILKRRNFWQGVGVVFAATLAIVWVTYSALGRDSNGFVNFFRAFAFWAETGDKGNGHQKPFYYWLSLMGQYEWMALAGLVLAPFSLARVPSVIRLLSVVSVGVWLAYSIVNYKTPWCVLSFYWGLILIAAYWIDVWVSKKRPKKQSEGFKRWVVAALMIGFSFSFWQGYQAAYAAPDQDGHPYIYGQTYRDLMVPLRAMLEEADANPELLKSRRIQVVSTFTWPLPYILGPYKQTGFYGESNAPQVLDADYILMDVSLEPKIAPRIAQVAQYDRQQVRARQWASEMAIYRKRH